MAPAPAVAETPKEASEEASEERTGREYDEEPRTGRLHPADVQECGTFHVGGDRRSSDLKPEQVFQALGVTSAAGIADPKAAWETLRNSA